VLLKRERTACRCRAYADWLSFAASVTLLSGARAAELDDLIDDVLTASATAFIKSEALHG
jgi:hypothetical protein